MMFTFVVCVLALGFVRATDRTCEPIRIDTCQDIGYNVTGMPNLVGLELQQDAQLQLQTFTPLIQYGCSSRLKFFLCSVYVPMCTEKVPVPIGPCRSLCIDVRNKCQPVLQEFGFPWPAGLNCSFFPPQNNDKHMCMEGPADQKGSENQKLPIKNRNRRPMVMKKPDKKPHDKTYSQHYGQCKKFRFSEKFYFVNRTQRCAPLCSANINFSSDNKSFADWWLTVLTVACLVGTVFNALLIILGKYRFRYSDGAVVIINFCYMATAIAYGIRLIAGRYQSSCHLDPQHNVSVLIQEGLDNIICVVVFVLLYFFHMSIHGWWVILCFTWFLSKNRKWTSEEIYRNNSMLQLLAWTPPFILTSCVLVKRIIDADELLGNCYVGNQSDEHLLTFVIIPTAVYLTIGCFLAILSVCPCKPKTDKYAHVPMDRANPLHLPRVPENDESATTMTGVFMWIYHMPTLCILIADICEYNYRQSWFAADSHQVPNMELFSVKVFMLLIMGTACCAVIYFSDIRKKAYQNLRRQILREKKPVPSYLQVQPQVLCAARHTKRSMNSIANSETIL